MKRFWILGMALAVSLLVAVGYADAAPKGKVVIGMSSSPPTFDPHRVTGFPLHQHYPLVFDNLFNRDQNGKMIPALATSWKYLSPKVLELKIRQGIKFANGEDVDAHAVKYSLDRIRDPKLKSRQRRIVATIKEIVVVDKYTVQIHTKKPDTFLIEPMANYVLIVPPKYYSKNSLEFLARNPVGSGPYKLVRWKKGEEFVYEARPGYWNPSKQRIKSATFKIIPEPNTRVSALLAGDVDFIDVVPPPLVNLLKGNPHIDVITAPSRRTCNIGLIIKGKAPWTDIRVRKALNYAVDKEGLLKNILQGYGNVVASNVGPGSFGYNPALKPYPYDPAKARKLLADAGYANGFEVEILVALGRFLMGKQATEAIAGQLAKVGIKAKVKAVTWGGYNKRSKTRWEPHTKPFFYLQCRMDMYAHSAFMYAGQVHSKSPRGGFRDKEMDKLIDEARTIIDDKKRERFYQNINRIIHSEKTPLLFLWRQHQIHAKNKRIQWKPRGNSTIMLTEMSLK